MHTGPHPQPLPTAAEVVIVGGGVIGVSIAWHLCASGVRNVVLVERDRLGGGSSAKPLGGVRATFSDPGNIRLGQRSLEAYESFSRLFGVDIGLQQVGYLFLARTDAELEQLQCSVAVQQGMGSSARMVSPAEAARLNPLIEPATVRGASFSPRDGHAIPAAVVHGYSHAAQTLGATILEQVEVVDIELQGGRIHAVHTSHGSVMTPSVVCAAGAWSSQIGNLVGVDLPVEPVRRQIGLTAQLTPPFPTVPFTLDLGSSLYFHNYPRGMLLGISNRDQTPGFDRHYDAAWVRAFDAAARTIAPTLVGRELEGGWAGLYENTPDHNALIGAARRVDGFFYATGFSGHGFLQAPAVGEVIRDLFYGRPPVIDVSCFNARRFRSGKAPTVGTGSPGSDGEAVATPTTEVHII